MNRAVRRRRTATPGISIPLGLGSPSHFFEFSPPSSAAGQGAPIGKSGSTWLAKKRKPGRGRVLPTYFPGCIYQESLAPPLSSVCVVPVGDRSRHLGWSSESYRAPSSKICTRKQSTRPAKICEKSIAAHERVSTCAPCGSESGQKSTAAHHQVLTCSEAS